MGRWRAPSALPEVASDEGTSSIPLGVSDITCLAMRLAVSVLSRSAGNDASNIPLGVSDIVRLAMELGGSEVGGVPNGSLRYGQLSVACFVP